jgi:EpsI family protein
MKTIPLKSWIIGLSMVAAALLAIVLTPTRLTAATAPKIDLETMIPKQFGDWHQLQELDVIAVSPEVQANLNKIYQQTLARTYVNSKGEQIMLSLAYGGDQRDGMQVHKPEVCYPAQGFQVTKLTNGTLDTGFSQIPVKRLLTTQGTRIEPITYWIIIGDTVAIDNFKWKLDQLKYGLTGKIPDGMIFRVSSIGDMGSAYAIQEEFIRDLLKSLPTASRKHLIGDSTSQP